MHAKPGAGCATATHALIIDDETWAIRYLVVNTNNWWPGKIVLISPEWVNKVSWEESKVIVNLSMEIIKLSPEYKPEFFNRDYEAALYRHYDQKIYWRDEVDAHIA